MESIDEIQSNSTKHFIGYFILSHIYLISYLILSEYWIKKIRQSLIALAIVLHLKKYFTRYPWAQ